MQVAIAAARRAEGRSGPNPPVGCAIISSNGQLIAVGHTALGGRPHAETEALAIAGEAAQGATAYVTLEPCAHTGQTGPCADALVEAGISRVVIAARDPDDRVNGRGIERLADNGVDIQIGVEAEAARQVMAGFLARVTMSRPLVTLKTATSLDGMIALGDGAKRWITGADMRRYVHLQRSRSDGLLSAIGTVLADDPEFTCRTPGLEADSPHRFILLMPICARLPMRGCLKVRRKLGSPYSAVRIAIRMRRLPCARQGLKYSRWRRMKQGVCRCRKSWWPSPRQALPACWSRAEENWVPASCVRGLSIASCGHGARI